METRYVRMVASLCAQTYYMHKLTVCSLNFYNFVAVIVVSVFSLLCVVIEAKQLTCIPCRNSPFGGATACTWSQHPLHSKAQML